MKKIFTLIVACVATMSAFAQSAQMYFIGNSDFYIQGQKESTITNTVKDTMEIYDMNMVSKTANIIIPAMHYPMPGSGTIMTIPAFTIKDATFSFTYPVATFEEQDYSTTTIDDSGATRDVAGTVSGSYSNATGALNINCTVKYGSLWTVMKMVVVYESTGYYTLIGNEWGLPGRGTAANPFRIFEPADFAAMAKNCTSERTGNGLYFQMMNDVDFAGVTYSPIAYSGQITAASAKVQFAGTFDGNSKTVKNLTYNDASAKCTGLFGTVASTGLVKNVIVDNTCSFASNQYGGSIVGMLLGKVEGCTNNANVTTSGTAAAGIVGNVQAGASVTGCSNTGSIQAATYAAGIAGMTIGAATFEDNTNSGAIKVVGSVSVQNKAVAAAHAAGIVGGGNGTCTVKNCTNNGTVTNNGFDKNLYPEATYALTSDGKNAGGIVGYTTAIFTVTGCTNNGAVTGLANAGGIIGGATKASTIDHCTNNGVVTCTDAATAGNLRGASVIVLGEGNIINSSLAKLALDPDPSAINNVNANTSTSSAQAHGKFMVGGKLVIVKDGKQFNAAGAQMK